MVCGGKADAVAIRIVKIDHILAAALEQGRSRTIKNQVWVVGQNCRRRLCSMLRCSYTLRGHDENEDVCDDKNDVVVFYEIRISMASSLASLKSHALNRRIFQHWKLEMKWQKFVKIYCLLYHTLFWQKKLGLNQTLSFVLRFRSFFRNSIFQNKPASKVWIFSCSMTLFTVIKHGLFEEKERPRLKVLKSKSQSQHLGHFIWLDYLLLLHRRLRWFSFPSLCFVYFLA